MGAEDRLPGLHALRLFAAWAVFLLHVIFWSARFVQPAVDFVFAWFQLGVQLFYVVSAFALMHSTRLYSDRGGWPAQFYTKRFFRIAPLYYVMIVATLIHLQVVYGTPPDPLEIVTNVLFINNFWPEYVPGIPFAGWSVSVEMLFYLVFPILFVTIRSIWAAVLLLAVAIGIGEVSRFYFDRIPGEIEPYGAFSIFSNFRYFAYGMLAFLIYDRLRQTRWGSPEAKAGTVAAYHLTFGALSAAIFAAIVIFHEQLRPLHRLDMVVWGALFMVVTIWVTARRASWLNWAPIQWLGERSYSLYLMHMLVVVYMQRPNDWLFHQLQPVMGDWALAPVIVVVWLLVVAVSAVTYALIERPGMALGKQIGRSLKRGAAAAPAATGAG